MGEWREWRHHGIGGWTRGEGENHFLLLHGGPGISDYLEGVGDLLAEDLGRDWSIVRYQQRGLSPSTTEGPFTVEQEVQDVLDVCSSLSAKAIWVLGHSWGGHLAMHALVASDRFRGAVIVDPLGAVGDGGRAAMFTHFASRLSPDEATEWLRLEELSKTQGFNADRRIAQDSILWRYYFSEPDSAPPFSPIRPGPGDHSKSIAEHFEKETLAKKLPSVSTPTLFLAGTKSPIPHEESLLSADLMPRAEVVLLPTGHFPWLESPAKTIEPICAFLSKT